MNPKEVRNHGLPDEDHQPYVSMQLSDGYLEVLLEARNVRGEVCSHTFSLNALFDEALDDSTPANDFDEGAQQSRDLLLAQLEAEVARIKCVWSTERQQKLRRARTGRVPMVDPTSDQTAEQ